MLDPEIIESLTVAIDSLNRVIEQNTESQDNSARDLEATMSDLADKVEALQDDIIALTQALAQAEGL